MSKINKIHMLNIDNSLNYSKRNEIYCIRKREGCESMIEMWVKVGLKMRKESNICAYWNHLLSYFGIKTHSKCEKQFEQSLLLSSILYKFMLDNYTFVNLIIVYVFMCVSVLVFTWIERPPSKFLYFVYCIPLTHATLNTLYMNN